MNKLSLFTVLKVPLSVGFSVVFTCMKQLSEKAKFVGEI